MSLVLIIVIAYALDLVFGDPQWHWHPVRTIGRLIERLERKLNTDKANKIFSGVAMTFLLVGLAMLCVWLALGIAKFMHPFLYGILSIIFIYFALSVRSLAVEANKVYGALKNKNVKAARKYLSMIVARDTQKLDEREIIRATVETVAESIMDGIIAPLSYVFLGGPVLMWGYKAINTLDSMVGYRSERFIEFGKVSAKVDGIVNFIPAKITCFLICLSSLCYKKDWVNSLRWGFKYFLKGQEFNSIATEAAMAGALRIRLGGVNFYDSVPIEKPFIGNNAQPLAVRHIRESIRIAYVSSVLFICVGTYLFYLIGGG